MHWIALQPSSLPLAESAQPDALDAKRVITKGLAMREMEKDDRAAKQRGRETLAKLR